MKLARRHVAPTQTVPNWASNPRTGKSYSKDKDGVWKDNKTGKPVVAIPVGAIVDAKNPNNATLPGGTVYVKAEAQKPQQGAVPGGNQGLGPTLQKKLDDAKKQQQAIRDALPNWQSKVDYLVGQLRANRKT